MYPLIFFGGKHPARWSVPLRIPGFVWQAATRRARGRSSNAVAEMSAHKEAGRRPASPAQTSDRDEDDSHDQQALLHKNEDPSRAKQPSRMLDMLVTLTYCLVYLLVGPALILVNKKIMKVCSCMLSPELPLTSARGVQLLPPSLRLSLRPPTRATQDVGFAYPMMVSGLGQLSSAICSALAIKVVQHGH